MNDKVWNEGLPDWADDGKRVEIVRDGAAVEGTLEMDDWFSLPCGDEVPVFGLRTDAGEEVCFADHDHWRFVDAPRERFRLTVEQLQSLPPEDARLVRDGWITADKIARGAVSIPIGKSKIGTGMEKQYGLRRMLCKGAGIEFQKWADADENTVTHNLELQLANVVRHFKVPGCTLQFKSYMQADFIRRKCEQLGLLVSQRSDSYGYSIVTVQWSEFLGDKLDDVTLTISADWKYDLSANGKKFGLDTIDRAIAAQNEAAVVDARLDEIKRNSA